MFNYKDYKVFLACGSTDMRKNINGLCEIVQRNFELDPSQKIIFGFCNRQHNCIKLLVWEDNGFGMHFKCLEKGSIILPEVTDDERAMHITLKDFENLIKVSGVKQKIKYQLYIIVNIII